MKTYTVKEIAALLQINPETVRRWIRDGKMGADITTRKSGNVISEDAFNAFLKSFPKYEAIKSNTLLLSAATILGYTISQLVETSNDANRGRSVSDLKKRIGELQKSISVKEETIKQLESEIAESKNQLRALQSAIEALQSNN